MLALNETRIDQFNRDGYFVVENLLDSELDLRPVEEEYAARLDDLAAKWYAEGRLRSTYDDYPFGKRMSKILVEVGLESHQFFRPTFPESVKRSSTGEVSSDISVSEDLPIHLGPALFNLLRSPRVLDVIQSLIGPEIYSHPLQLVRLKVPENMVPQSYWDGVTNRVDWHQDLGVVLSEADHTDMISVWFPMTDATIENGCLVIAPGSHHDGLALHCLPNKSKGKPMTHIPEDLVPLDRAIPMPMKRGSALFFHRRLMHSSLPNNSHDLRWSFDFRYTKIGQPTGRSWLPGFVARSRQNPESELHDWREWADLWLQARTRLAGNGNRRLHRWDDTSPVCL